MLTQSDRLLSFRLALAPDRDIVVARDHTGGFVVEDQDRPTREVPTLGSGTIHTSLAAAAGRAGVPAGVLAEMIRAFSYDVDFEREIQPGDTFTVLYAGSTTNSAGRPGSARWPMPRWCSTAADPAVPLHAERRRTRLFHR